MKKNITISALTLVLLLSACSEQKTAQQLILSGNDFVQTKNISSAIIEFKNAVRIEPQNPNARFGLGRAYLQQGNYLYAEKELSRALELGLDFSTVAPLMARVKTRLFKAEDVYTIVKRSNDLTDTDYIQVLTYAGISALSAQEISRGQDYLTQATAINQTSPYSQLAKAYLLYSQKSFPQSLEVVNTLLTVQQETQHNSQQTHSSEATLLQGHLYFALQDFEQASDIFSLYLISHPLDHSVRFFEVKSLMKAEKYEQASILTDALLKSFKDSPLALQYKAEIEYQKQNYTVARDFAEQALQNNESLIVAKMVAGVSSYFLGDVEQAYNKLSAIAELLPNNHLVQKILAVTRFELGYYSDAASSFASLEGLTPADITLLKNSSLSLKDIGDFDNALTLMNKAEKLAPDSAELAAEKGFMLLSENEVGGIQSMERAVQLDPSLTHAQIALAIEYLKAGQEDKAQTIIDKYKTDDTEGYIGYILEGLNQLDKNQKDAAIVSFEKARALKPDNIASLYNLGLLHQKLKEASVAISYFNQVLKLSPEHKGSLKSLVLLANENESLEEVLTVLTENYHTDRLYSAIALAQVLRVNGQVIQAIAKLKAVSKHVKLTSNYFILLGDCYLQVEQFEEANTVFSQGLIVEPKHYFLNVRYISILELLGHYPLALEQAKKAHAYYKNDTTIIASLIYLEVKNKNYREAKTLLQALNKEQQTNHHLLDTVAGEIYTHEKKYPQAIEYFSAAYDKKPTELNLLNLARTLKFDEQNKEAEHLLESYLEKKPENARVRFLLAELYGNQDRAKKIEQYSMLMSLVPNNPLVFNNIAWNQFEMGLVDKALINIERAYKLQPGNLAIQESYGVILVANKKLVEGINILEKAITSGSTDTHVKESIVKAKALLKKAKK